MGHGSDHRLPPRGLGGRLALVDTKQVTISGILQALLSLGAPADFLLLRFVAAPFNYVKSRYS